MRTAVLLGAGASRDAGIPVTNDMTRKIYDLTTTEQLQYPGGERLGRALGTVIGGLTFQQGIRGEDPHEGLNVENVFASVRMLANRNDIEAAPFIGSWHSVIDELDEEPISNYEYDRFYKSVRDSIAEELGKVLAKSSGPLKQIDDEYKKQTKSRNPKFEWGKWIGNAFNKALGEVQKHNPPLRAKQNVRKRLGGMVDENPRSGRGEIYLRLADHMIRSLKDLVWVTDNSQIDYLAPLLRLGEEPITIYSLNYDNLIELLCNKHGVSYSVGLEGSKAVEFDKEANLNLVKLHGSIDWIESTLGNHEIRYRGYLPSTEIRVASEREIESDDFYPAVIFGQGNKLTTQGPYLDLLRHFQLDLESRDHLLIVGYSFRDDHINDYIGRWMRADGSRSLTLLCGKNFEREAQSNPFTRELLQHEEHRINVVPEYTKDGLGKAMESVPA